DNLVGGFHCPDRNRTRALHFAVDMHGAGPALRDTAAVFGAGQTDMFANDPQERRVVFDLHVAHFAVDVQFRHVSSPGTVYGRQMSWRAYGPLWFLVLIDRELSAADRRCLCGSEPSNGTAQPTPPGTSRRRH